MHALVSVSSQAAAAITVSRVSCSVVAEERSSVYYLAPERYLSTTGQAKPYLNYLPRSVRAGLNLNSSSSWRKTLLEFSLCVFHR